MIQDILNLSGVLLLASFVQGLTGFGLGLVAVALFSLTLGPQIAIPLTTCFGFLITVPLVLRMWPHVRLKDGLYLALASFPGAYLGAIVLKTVPADYILLSIGLILAATSSYSILCREPLVFHLSPRVTTVLHNVIGFFAGFLGTSTGGPGALGALWLNSQSWKPASIKATLSFFFMLQGAGALLILTASGLLTEKLFVFALGALPGFVVGTILGLMCFDFFQRKHWNYRTLVHIFLLIIGLRLFWVGSQIIWGRLLP